MRKIEKLKAALKNLLVEFRSVNTDKAVLSWDGEEDLKEGFSVYVTDEEGNHSIPEDGEYVDEEKITYVVENGIVKEVIPAPDENPEEQPEAPAEEPVEETPAEEPVEEPVEETPAEEPVEEKPEEEPAEEPVEETPAEEVADVAEEANELAEKVEALVEKINTLVEEVEQLKAFRKVVEDMSAGKPAQQQFRETSIDPNRSNNKELDKISQLFQ
jgi:outer membrane biosynthesis protein TonB